MDQNGGISVNSLEKLTVFMHGVDGATAARLTSVNAVHGHISALMHFRSERVAALLSGYPRSHWLVIASLNISIFIAFLFESNQVRRWASSPP